MRVFSSSPRRFAALLASVLFALSFAQASAAGAGGGAPLLVYRDGKCGYTDREGRWLVAPRFRSCDPFEGGMAGVWLDERHLYVDASGRLLEDRNFASNHFSEGLIPVNIGEKYGFADAEGRLVVFPRFEGASDFSEGLAPAKSGGKWGYIDRAGEFRIAPQFDTAESFSEGLAAVCLYEGGPPKLPEDRNEPLSGEALEWYFSKGPKQRCGYVGRAGEFRIAPRFGDAGRFSGGLARVCVGRCAQRMPPKEGDDDAPKWGYVDESGRVVVAAQFREAGDFAEGLAPVKVGSKWGYIDASGRLAVAPRFESARGFDGGLALVFVGEKKYYWPHRGLTVLGVKFKGRFGYVDRSGGFVSDKLSWKG